MCQAESLAIVPGTIPKASIVADSAEATGLKWAAPAGGGKVLQVVSATTSTNVSVTTATYTDTNLSATITPSSATSKILVLTSQPIYVTRGNNEAGAGVRLLRGATTILDQGGTGFYNHQVYVANGTSVGNQSVNSQSYLDSPATTSATTYKTQIRCYTATNSATAQAQIDNMVSSMILLEIGA